MIYNTKTRTSNNLGN